MINYALLYGMAGFGTVLTIFWVFLYIRYHNQFDEVQMAIDGKQFFMPELFFIGFGVIDLFKINLKTTAGRKKEKKLSEIYGQKYAPFYHYCIMGAQITYLLTLLPIGLYVGVIVADLTFTGLAVVMTIVIVLYLDMQVNQEVEKRRDEILADYPDMLAKLTLLVNAGMVVREAWKQIAYSSDRILYKEMQLTSEEMQNGVSELDALYQFAERCALKEIRKFVSVLSQNIQKGGAELALSLKYMNKESWEDKKNRAKVKGEVAGQKLMIPTMMIFVGILMMICVPIFTNML